MAVLTCKVKWTKDLSIENNELDEQHMRLFEFTNNLLLCYDSKDDRSVVLRAINSLVDFSIYHFEHEEDVLRERGYPDLERHIDLHDKFRTRISQFKEQLDNGELNVLDDMIIYLIDWVKEHITVEDLDYKKYMN
jgi:hemerythrin-like metal-binding protein